ncbi:hypothetical protein, partial [Desulfobulbus elongatus]|uniref:hypothetical protein n=1 Tax=Desulfobulbus elongatus TaxID=53332 RepID=UPI001B8076E6
MNMTTLTILLFLCLFTLATPRPATARGKHVLMVVTGADRTRLGKPGSSSFGVDLLYIGIKATPNDEGYHERQRYHCV